MSKAKQKKGNWKIYVGVFCLIGAVVMLFEDIIAALFYAVAAIIFFYLGMKNSNVQKEDEGFADNQEDKKPVDMIYVMNPQTMVLHRRTCPYAQKAFIANKYNTDNRRAAISVGYQPCKYCKP